MGDGRGGGRVGHVGREPELLVDAVQPGGAGQDRGFASHHAGDRAIAFPVPGSQDRATRRRCAGAVQRSLRGARNDGAVYWSTARDCAGWQSVRARAGGGASKTFYNQINCNGCRGILTFKGAYTRQPGFNATGSAVADFLTGVVSGAQLRNLANEKDVGRDLEGFAQDRWRISARLSLTL